MELHSQEIFPSSVFCYSLNILLMYIVGVVAESRGATLNTHVTVSRRASAVLFRHSELIRLIY